VLPPFRTLNQSKRFLVVRLWDQVNLLMSSQIIPMHIYAYLHVSTRIYAYPHVDTRIYMETQVDTCTTRTTQMTSYGGKITSLLVFRQM
jgi:hypothetical protein